jgi:hypothetical protein
MGAGFETTQPAEKAGFFSSRTFPLEPALSQIGEPLELATYQSNPHILNVRGF